MKPHSTSISLLVVIACLSLCGCAATVAGMAGGVGVYTYLEGELIRNYSVPQATLATAAFNALDRLNIRVVEQEDGGRVVHGRLSDATPVRLTLQPLAPDLTEVGIRCGVLGGWDRRSSEVIHVAISQELSRS